VNPASFFGERFTDVLGVLQDVVHEIRQHGDHLLLLAS